MKVIGHLGKSSGAMHKQVGHPASERFRPGPDLKPPVPAKNEPLKAHQTSGSHQH